MTKRWRADGGEEYWYIFCTFDDNKGIPVYETDIVTESLSYLDDMRYYAGNYFASEEEAQAEVDKLITATKPIWDELKPKQLKPERWNPKKGKDYYYAKFIPHQGEFVPDRMTYLDDPFDNGCLQHGNCFETEAEAQDLSDKWNEKIRR